MIITKGKKATKKGFTRILSLDVVVVGCLAYTRVPGTGYTSIR